MQKEPPTNKYSKRAQKYNETIRTNNQTVPNSSRSVGKPPNPENLSDRGSKSLLSQKSILLPNTVSLEEEFKKQTRLESHVTMLTVKRTMT